MADPPLPPVHLPIDPDAPPLSADQLAGDAGAADRPDEVLETPDQSGPDRHRTDEQPPNPAIHLPPD